MFETLTNDFAVIKHASSLQIGMVKTNRWLVKLFRKGWACMTSSEKPRPFCMKSQLIVIATDLNYLFINNQKLVDLLFQPLTRKDEIRGDAFSKSLSIYTVFRKYIIYTTDLHYMVCLQ